MNAEVGGGAVAVLGVGKSTVKLSAFAADGVVCATFTLANGILPGPPLQE